MTRPTGHQIRAAMPRREWFRIPTQVRKQYPDTPDYDFYIMIHSINRILNKDLKWGTVQKRSTGNEVFWCI